MTVPRHRLEADLESYVLDLLDVEAARAIERSLPDHPDLAARVAELQQSLTALAYEDRVVAPSPLRSRVLEAAAARRTPGFDADGVVGASGVTCYRQVAGDVGALIDELSHDEMVASTLYGIPVVELIRHLSGMDAFLTVVLDAHGRPPDAGPGSAIDHRALRDDSDASRPDQVVAAWHRNADALLALVSTWSEAEATAAVQVGQLTLPGEAVLIARAFELWTHAEDICRATGRSLRVPAPEVLRSMADTAVDLLVPLVGTEPRHVGKTVRVTLTGSGGGSWVRRVSAPTEAAATTDAACTADATLVADVVDFCRLVADRVDPWGEFAAHRQGDDGLLDDVIRRAPMLADFGAGPLPR